MLRIPKCRHPEKNGWEKVSAALMIAGGLAATAYFSYLLIEKIKSKRKLTSLSKYGCEDAPVEHEYDHVSENDCLCHEKKDYYHTCGCFDTEDGNPPICDDKDMEERL